jgi:hypothetical protein
MLQSGADGPGSKRVCVPSVTQSVCCRLTLNNFNYPSVTECNSVKREETTVVKYSCAINLHLELQRSRAPRTLPQKGLNDVIDRNGFARGCIADTRSQEE